MSDIAKLRGSVVSNSCQLERILRVPTVCARKRDTVIPKLEGRFMLQTFADVRFTEFDIELCKHYLLNVCIDFDYSNYMVSYSSAPKHQISRI